MHMCVHQDIMMDKKSRFDCSYLQLTKEAFKIALFSK